MSARVARMSSRMCMASARSCSASSCFAFSKVQPSGLSCANAGKHQQMGVGTKVRVSLSDACVYNTGVCTLT